MIAEVIINSNAKALNRIFDYIVPKEIESNIEIGNRVFVPFGNGKKIEDGFIIGLKQNSEFANKEIVSIAESDLNKEKIELAKLMSQKYFCNISDCIRLMLPPGTSDKKIENRVKEKVSKFVYLSKDEEEIRFLLESKVIKSEKQRRLLEFLIENDGVNKSDLELLTDVSSSVMQTLEKNGYIEFVEKQIERNPFQNKNIERDEPLKLTKDQQECYDSIGFLMDNNEFAQFLIYGVTGSRKNRNIYATYRKGYFTR